MPTLLSGLEVEEISIVVYGANNKKFISRKGENREGKLFFEKNGVDNMVDDNAEKLRLDKEAEEKARLDKEAAEKVVAEKLEKEAKIKAEKEALEAKEKLEKENQSLKERLEKAEAVAKEAFEKAEIERQARLNKEFVDLAKGFPMLGDAAKLGPVLKECSEKLSKESYDAIITMLKADNAKLEKSKLFVEVGKEGGEGDIDPAAKLDALAKEYMTKNSVTYTAAMSAVIAVNKELYADYTRKQTKRIE